MPSKKDGKNCYYINQYFCVEKLWKFYAACLSQYLKCANIK